MDEFPLFSVHNFFFVFLQGEQCNIVPDNIDDIVADLAPEEKEEGTFEINLCTTNNLYFVPFSAVTCR